MHRSTAFALVFLASASVLVLEIMAGRMLAPYLGVTLETFTGIIGTVLAGISLGAWAGGRLADRHDPGSLLGPLFLIGAVTTFLAPSLVRWMGPTVRGAGPVEIVLATALAFFLPALVLSAIPPAIVKIQLQDLGHTGEVVGGFSAVSSAGAIFGTFVTGFVLVAAAPSRAVIVGVGVLLAVVGGTAWFRYGGRSRPAPLVSIALVGVLGVAAALATPSPCQRETAYFCARVDVDTDRPTGRILWLDTLRHSYVDLEDPTHLEFRYAQVVGDVLAALPAGPLRTLHVGGGGFTFPSYIDAVRPGSSHLVLELDPAIVAIAEEQLGLELSEDLRVRTGDARLGIEEAPPAAFDLVFGDAFGGPAVPWHLTTEEFLTDVAARLDGEGLYVMNLIDHPPHRFAKAQAATIAAVFPHVLVVAPPSYLNGEEGGNIVLGGSKTPFDVPTIMAGVTARGGEEIALTGADAVAWLGSARVLRDDFAPVDQLVTRRSRDGSG